MLRILLLGKGGREHALAWKLNTSPIVEHVYVVPGNGGTAYGMAKVSNIEVSRVDDYPALMALAKSLDIGLVVAGTDQAAVDGLEGFCRDAGITCFAPTKSPAVIEGSKTWAKDFMRRHGIPTASHEDFGDYGDANAYLYVVDYPVFIKASGLAAGKGVVIARDFVEADETLKDILLRSEFGAAGAEVVIEEYLDGEEISVLTFSDGVTTRSSPAGQGHQRIFEGSRGPNTGGMGVVAPTPQANPDVMKRIEDEILQPTFAGLRYEGLTYTGMLFTGVMLTDEGPKNLEHNARFGGPETQSILPLLLENTDLAEIMLACTQRCLSEVRILTRPLFACNVVIVAGGYPENYAQGDQVEIGDIPYDVILYHAGTHLVKGRFLTAGGRVLCVAATGATMDQAILRANDGVKLVSFKDMFFRKDIGQQYAKISSVVKY